MTQTTNLNVKYYLDLALRRKWWIIVSFVLSLIIGFVCIKVIPKTFRANTLILVQSQKIPDSYIHSTVTESVQSRLHTISQQIYSRTNLEKIIKEFNLIKKENETETEKKSVSMLIESLRRKIKVDMRQSDKRSSVQAFEISFEWHDSGIAANVTNAIASQFIEENLKVREAMAMGTTDFLQNEVTKIKKNLENQEKAVEEFKKKYMGMLPDQLKANIDLLGQLKEQLSNVAMNVRNEQEKSIFLRRQMELLEALKLNSKNTNGIGNPLQPVTVFSRLDSFKQQLEKLRSRYTEKHPDVITLKREIAALETETQTQQEQDNDDKSSGSATEETHLPLSEGLDDIARQHEELKMELVRIKKNIGAYKAETEKIKQQISLYSERIERTPEIELQLIKLTRDYATIQKRYGSLLDKKINAQLSEQLERRQKGEQFKVIDPAIASDKPVKPDVKKIMLIALMAGLGIGCGLAYLREIIDGSFYSTDDLESFLETRILVSIPSVKGNI
ncbi:MAG: GumC family protein [Methanosarcinaceae archaeon]